MNVNKRSHSIIEYIFLVGLLAFSSFEFFFRERLVLYVFYLLAILYCIVKNKPFKLPKQAWLFTFFYIFMCVVRVASPIGFSALYGFFAIIGSIALGIILKKDFLSKYVWIMFWIGLYSTIIWGFTFIPPVKSFLFEVVSIHFPPLNPTGMEIDSSNILVYNLYNGGISQIIGFSRNCGPFWEPGQFGIFLNIALFINLFISKTDNRFCNIVLLVAIISTFSTGTLAGTAALFVYFAFTRKGAIMKLLSLIVVGLLLAYLTNLEIVGGKINQQITEASAGSGLSRFSAMLTQFQMIKDYPLLGGGDVFEYSEDGGAASGVFWVFVVYGIPLGVFFYVFYFLSFTKLCEGYNWKERGLTFALFILFLSLSQTIITTRWMLVFIVIGLMYKKEKVLN